MDENIRRLERDASAGGMEARVRLLRERVRSGDIPRQGLEFAALLGDEASRLALSDEAPPQNLDREEWSRRVAACGTEAITRSLVEIARLVLPIWEQIHPQDQGVRNAIRATEGFVLNPPAEESSFRAASAQLMDSWNNYQADSDQFAAMVVIGALMAARNLPFQQNDGINHNNAIHLSTGLSFAVNAVNAQAAEQNREDQAGPRDIIDRISGQLIPWALREGDPIADRVNARAA